MDLYCLRVLETEEGYPFTLLDFAQYAVLSTDQNPCMVAHGMEVWMREVVHPMMLASSFWRWMHQLAESRAAIIKRRSSFVKSF